MTVKHNVILNLQTSNDIQTIFKRYKTIIIKCKRFIDRI